MDTMPLRSGMRIGAVFRVARHEGVRLCWQGDEVASSVVLVKGVKGPQGVLHEATEFVFP